MSSTLLDADAFRARVQQALARDYEVLSEIGRGRTAVVYLGQDLRLLSKVALKVLLPHSARADVAAEEFLGEARATARLGHPNIVPVYQAGENQGVHFVAMRHVDGCSLDRFLRVERRLPVVLSCYILAETARALEFAHGKGVVHGDVNPGNVLLDQAWGHPVVTGFGATSAHEPGLAQNDGVDDRSAYTAPELAGGEAPTRASDQYALGAIAYQLLTGAPPPAAPPSTDRTAAQRDGPRRIRDVNPVCPISLETAVLRMLAPNPEARWSQLDDLLTVLLRYVGESEVPQQKELRRRIAAVLAAPESPSPRDDSVSAIEDVSLAGITGSPRSTPPSGHASAVDVSDLEVPFRDDAVASRAARDAAATRLTAERVYLTRDDVPEPPPAVVRRSRWRARVGVAVVLAATAVAVTLSRGRGDAAARGSTARPAPKAADSGRLPETDTVQTRAAGEVITEAPTTGGAAPSGAASTGAAAGAAGATGSAPPPAMQVVVEPQSDSVAVGDSVRLRVRLVGPDGRAMPAPAARQIRWRSTDASRVRVSSAGWARARRAGRRVTITATVNGALGRTRLRVVPAPVVANAQSDSLATERSGSESVVIAPGAAEALVNGFVRALRARDLGALQSVLAAGGGASPDDVTRWLQSRRDFGAALDNQGPIREDGGASAMEFRVQLSWKTRSLKDLHRGGTRHMASAWFRATFERDTGGWTLQRVAPINRFPP